MRTGMHTWSFRERFKQDQSFTIFEALDQTAAMGLTAVEIMAGKADSPPGDFERDDLPYLDSVKRHAEKLGVDIVCLSTYNDFAFVTNEAWRQANIAYIKKWLQIAADMGVPNIRMLTGYYVEGKDRPRLEQLTYDGIAECVPVAEQTGTNMAIENHNSIFFSADEMLQLIDSLSSPRLTTCPDPTNWDRTFFSDEPDAASRAGVFEQLAKVAPRATQSHLKIRGVSDDGRLLGYGDDLDRIIGIYHAAGYDGVIAFESVYKDGDLLEPLPEARRIVEDAIARVATAAAK